MLTQTTVRGLPAIRPRQARRAVCLRKVAALPKDAEHAVDFKTTAAMFALTALALEQPAFAATVAEPDQIVQRVQAAQAPSSDAVDSAIATVIDAVKNGGDLAKSAISALGRGVDAVYQGYKTAAPYLEDSYRKAEPTLKQGVDVAGKVASEAAKVAQPILKRGVEQAEEIIGQLEQSTGVTPQTLAPVVDTAKQTTGQALTVATPWFERFVNFVTTAEPLTLGQYAIALVLLYYSAPWLLRGFVGSLRGYSGDVTPAAALDLADKDGNAYIIDIRSQKDKEQLGVPDIASRNKVVDINYAEVDRKVRSNLRDPENIEAKTTALQVAGYKRLSRGNVLLLLDKYGNQSKAVAKELARLGFGKAYIISGGFEGRNGWVQSKLQIRGFTAPARGGALGTLLSSGTISTRGLAGKK